MSQLGDHTLLPAVVPDAVTQLDLAPSALYVLAAP